MITSLSKFGKCFIVLLLVFCGFFNVESSSLPKVVFVNSFAPDLTWYLDQRNGAFDGVFQSGFINHVNVEITELHLLMKYINLTPESRAKATTEVIANITTIDPSLLLCFDDLSFKFVCLPLQNRYKSVFVGINNPLHLINASTPFYNSIEKPGGNISGVYQFLGFIPGVKILKMMNPNLSGNKLLVVIDSTITGNSHVKQINLEIASKGYEVADVEIEMLQVANFAEYKELFETRIGVEEEIQATIIICFALEKEDSTMANKAEIYGYNVENNKKIIDACTNFVTSAYGCIGGVGANGNMQGFEAGLMIGQVLSGTVDIGDIPIVLEAHFSFFLNLDRVKDLGITLSDQMIKAAGDLVILTIDEVRDYTFVFILLGVVVVLLLLLVIVVIITPIVIVNVQERLIKHEKKVALVGELVEKISYMNLEDELVQSLVNGSQTFLSKKFDGLLKDVCLNLMKFVPYMPQHLFAKDENQNRTSSNMSIIRRKPYYPRSVILKKKKNIKEEDEEDDEHLDSNYTIDDDIQSLGSSKSERSYDLTSDSSSKGTIAGKNKKLCTGLFEKEISILEVKLINFDKILTKVAKDILSVVLTKFIEEIANIMFQTNGILYSFAGDSLIISWNTMNIVISHGIKACETALKIKKVIGEINEIFKDDLGMKFNFEIVCCSGTVVCGNVGEKIKRFIIVGEIFKRCEKLRNLNKNLNQKILIDENTYQTVVYRFICQVMRMESAISGIDNEKTSNQYVYCLHSENTVKKDEWLYELKEGNLNNRYKSYNDAFFLTRIGKFSKALKNVKIYLKDIPNCKFGCNLEKIILKGMKNKGIKLSLIREELENFNII